MINWLGPLSFGLKNFISMILIVTVGPLAIRLLLKIISKWLTNGLTMLGSMCSVVGIGMLSYYSSLKKYIWVLLIGFVLSAYLKGCILGVLIIGLALLIYTYVNLMCALKKREVLALNKLGTTDDDEGDDYDE